MTKLEALNKLFDTVKRVTSKTVPSPASSTLADAIKNNPIPRYPRPQGGK